MMAPFKVGWYVVYTKPQHEKKVAENLNCRKVQNFFPTIKTLKVWVGKKRYVNLPLFPSYIFVKLESIQQYFETLQVPGALYFVRVGNQVASVRENIIDKLQTIALQSLHDIEVSSEYFSPGTILNINAGPFAGICCEMIQLKGKNKMLVRLELLHRSLIVDLPSYCVEPIAASRTSANI